MPRRALSSMTVNALVKLRDEIGVVLSRRVEELKTELHTINDGAGYDVKIQSGERVSLRGRKVPVKYRDKTGNSWAGRGAQPRWMTEAIRKGAKREDFLVLKTNQSVGKKRAVKRRRAGKKQKKPGGEK
jgi:DNA-binding protein H-NS